MTTSNIKPAYEVHNPASRVCHWISRLQQATAPGSPLSWTVSFLGAEVDAIEHDTTRCVSVEVDDQDDYDVALGAVQEFVEDAWNKLKGIKL